MNEPARTPVLPSALCDGDLVLRPMEASDAPAVHRIRNLPEVVRFQSWTPATVSEVEEVARAVATEGYRQWVIEVDGQVVGDMGIGPWGDPQVEWGIALDPEHQGRGHATRAVRLMIGHAFACGVHRVKSRVDPRNGPSMALMRRLHLREEGLERGCYWDPIDRAWTDEALFAVLASEWPESAPSHR